MKRKRDKNSAAGLDQLAEGVSEMVTDMLEKPTLSRLLPVQLGFALKDIVLSAPENYRQVAEMVKDAWRDMMEKRRMKKAKEVDSGGEEEEDEEEEEATTKKEKKPKRKRVALPEYSERPETTTSSSASLKDSSNASSTTSSSSPFPPARENQPWTEDDMSKLSKAMARFPVGTLNRWEKVAEFTERTVNEILAKNKEIRDSQFHRLNQVLISVLSAT